MAYYFFYDGEKHNFFGCQIGDTAWGIGQAKEDNGILILLLGMIVKLPSIQVTALSHF